MALVIGMVACVEGLAGAGQRGVARRANHQLRGQIDFPGHRARRYFRHVLRVDRDVTWQKIREPAVIEVRDLVVELNGNRILNGVTLDVYRGEILGFVGASGAGKSVLTRTILGLLPKLQGRIDVFGVNLDEAGETQRQEIERRWGILFQQGALFSSLTVRRKCRIPDPRISRYFGQSHDRNRHHQAGDGRTQAGRVPQISVRAFRRHDQARRARACAGARPEILFLDEPTSGLDPISAGDFDS